MSKTGCWGEHSTLLPSQAHQPTKEAISARLTPTQQAGRLSCFSAWSVITDMFDGPFLAVLEGFKGEVR